MAIFPGRSRSIREKRGERRRVINERAHAKRWENVVEARRTRQLMKARPKEFPKRQREHMLKYGRSVRASWQRLFPKLLKGELSKKETKELEHAAGGAMRADVDKARKAFKKLKEKGVAELSREDVEAINKTPGQRVPEKIWRERRRTKKLIRQAENRGLVERQSSGRLSLKKNLKELSRGDVQVLKDLGFNIPSYREIQRRYK